MKLATINEAIEVFFSGKKLIFGHPWHIACRDVLRRTRKGSKDYRVLEFAIEKYFQR
jgi:hypothetical protein